MKLIKVMTVVAFTVALLGGSALAAEKNCCEKAKDAGTVCAHKCCVAAQKDGKTCEKCAPKKNAKPDEKK